MIKRRDFLQQAAMVSAALVVAPSCVLSSSEKGGKKVGLQLYTLREIIDKDPQGVISKVAAAGYKEVETYGYLKESGFWGMKPKEFKQFLSSKGLTSPSGHYGFDEYIEGKEDILNVYLEAVTELGQDYLTVPYLNEPLRKNADDYKKVAEKLNKAGEAAKKANVTLAYHNHDFEFMPQGDTTGYEILAKETDPDLLKFEVDLYWAVRAKQDVASLFSAHKHRCVMWHVKDMDKAKPELNTEIGNGSIDYKSIFALSKEAGVKHYFVEQENFTNIDPFASIRKSADYVTKNLLS